MFLAGQKPFLGKLYQRMDKATSALEYFANNEWKWDTSNVAKLRDAMSHEDRERFNVSVEALNWNDYMKNYCLGTRQFILKDPLATMPSARDKLVYFRYAHTLLQIVLLTLCLKLVHMALWNLVL